MMIDLFNTEFQEMDIDGVSMVFADPPDNINLGYDGYVDSMPEETYGDFLGDIIYCGTEVADIVWISYNAIHTHIMGHRIHTFMRNQTDWTVKHCVQIFTFGQHNQHDLGNNHRPLVRLMRKGTTLYPDAVRVPSWRLLNGDKRADPRGRVPGDVFDFPRVTGNSKQRRKWHPTQLHEELYERCIRLSCKPTETVCDFFAGTGTLARACAKTGNPCVLVEIDEKYCNKIAEEHELTQISDWEWSSK
jgi:hypothetical protein